MAVRAGVHCLLVLVVSLIATGEVRGWLHGHVAAQLLRKRETGPAPTSYSYGFADDSFVDSLRSSLERLSSEHRPLLVHTRLQNDALVFLRDDGEAFTVPVVSVLYNNLKAISHLPVSVAAILAPEVSQTDQAQTDQAVDTLSPTTVSSLNQILSVLNRSRGLVTPENFPSERQRSRQDDIIDTTEEFASNLISGSQQLSRTTLRTFGESLQDNLRDNSQDAVQDYLVCLNSTISALLQYRNITEQEFRNMSVLVALPPFAEPQSFITQYYEQLLGYQFQVTSDSSNTERIILSPSEIKLNSSSSPLLPTNASILTLSNSTLTHTLTRTFYGLPEVYSSSHLFLNEAASSVICSPDLNFPSCSDDNSETEQSLPAGFSNRTERAYVIALISIGTFTVVLAILVGCVCREGEIMKRERRSLQRKGFTSFVAVNRESEDSNIGEEEEEGEEGEDVEEEEEQEEEKESSETENRSARKTKRVLSNNRVRRWRRRQGQYSVEKRARPVTYSEVSLNQ